MALQLAAKGRHKPTLEAAHQEVLTARKSTSQTVDAISVDLIKADNVDATLRSVGRVPDIVICSAGALPNTVGFSPRSHPALSPHAWR
ncbi:NAD(P)-binding protein [Penicillium hordei]|uniref:NAD(P)-binding protein n=1 Tax=Penicillium hordei TaxID=40994 RepID=A0AAD6E807_9EURO|nr:NAD(P)-binding protein [Penicillium hordei]KAJ5603782.1 NAD(P)-binding protein [Penicillium hordei]